MTQNVTIFGLEAVEAGWWAKELQADGWFDRDSLDLPTSANATANGTVLTATYSLTPGAASAGTNATANGVTLTETHSLIAGAASGQANASASGVTLTAVSYALLSGSAQGQANASAGGATLLQTAQIIAGTASATANPTAGGFTGNVTYIFAEGAATGAGTARIYRGDDGGELRRYWAKWAEDWIKDTLGEISEAKGKPRRARKRLAAKIEEKAAEFEVTAPDLAPRIDALQMIAGWLASPEPDYTAIAAEIMRQRAIVDAWNLQQRRRRDMEALLILAA